MLLIQHNAERNGLLLVRKYGHKKLATLFLALAAVYGNDSSAMNLPNHEHARVRKYSQHAYPQQQNDRTRVIWSGMSRWYRSSWL
jgi:hypothetical protein